MFRGVVAQQSVVVSIRQAGLSFEVTRNATTRAGVGARGVSGCHDRARLGSQRRDLLVLRWAGCCRLRGQAEVMAVLVQPDFQQTDGSQEVMALQHHQVDVVRVLPAAK